MNVIDIFKKLQTEEGLEEIVEEVIECAFTSMEKEMQGLSKELKKKIYAVSVHFFPRNILYGYAG